MKKEKVAEKFFEDFIDFVNKADEASDFRNRMGKSIIGLNNYYIDYYKYNPNPAFYSAKILNNNDVYYNIFLGVTNINDVSLVDVRFVTIKFNNNNCIVEVIIQDLICLDKNLNYNNDLPKLMNDFNNHVKNEFNKKILVLDNFNI